MSPYLILRKMLDARLGTAARAWFKRALTEVADGVGNARFAALLSVASRHARDSQALEPSTAERRTALKAVEGWNPERWGLLETLRAALVLAHPELDGDGGALALEEAFRFADEGEQRALYRALPLLPGPERFRWRAGEGCRTNMRSVFEAVALDNPFPARFFDDPTFAQVAVKCLFVGAPLWRLWGLEARLTDELARMALDLADERRSAGREVPPELWLCLGSHGGARAVQALADELEDAAAPHHGRVLAAFALVRASEGERVKARLGSETHVALRAALSAAVDGGDPLDYCRTHLQED